ncbi:MAG: dihydroorotate dehydrogenase electron transfer subunit [Planctomycetota bacterium]
MSNGTASCKVLSTNLVGRYFICRIAVNWADTVIPGQFMMVHVPKDGERPLGRPLCISDRGDGWVEFTAAIVGQGTRAIACTKPGDELRVLGPLGKGFQISPVYRRIALVGGGVGIAELVLLSRQLNEQKRPAKFFAGARSKIDLVAMDRIAETSSSVAVVTEDGSEGTKGLVTEPLVSDLEKGLFDLVVACGPHGMLIAVASLAETHGVESLVATEERMACGIGACFGCTIPLEVGGKLKMVRVCAEGPVFRGKAFLGGLRHEV